MAALTAIRNPNHPEDTLIFFTTSYQQVGYDVKTEKDLNNLYGDGGAGGDGSRGGGSGAGFDEGVTQPSFGAPRSGGRLKDDAPVTGLVRHPGAFQALTFQNLVKVYAITTSNVIQEVSPGVRGLQQKILTKSGGLTGCGNGKDLAWLYYLSTAEVPQLKQFQLATGASVAVQGPPTPGAESSLSAWFKAKDQSRGVLYQNTGNTDLRYWEVQADGSQSNGQVANTTQAANKTPIANAVIGDKVFVWFVSSSNALIRAERVGSGSWVNQISDSSNDWNLNPLTATVALNGQYIVIRQQFSDDDGIFEWPDKRSL
jgi:hypothetical protein